MVAAPKNSLLDLESDPHHPPIFRRYRDYTWQEYRALWAWSLSGGLWSEEHRLKTLLEFALSRCKQDIERFQHGKNAGKLTSYMDKYLAVIETAITNGYFGHGNSGGEDTPEEIRNSYSNDYPTYVSKERTGSCQYLRRRISDKRKKIDDFDVIKEGVLQDTDNGILLKEAAGCFKSRTEDFVMYASGQYGSFLDSQVQPAATA